MKTKVKVVILLLKLFVDRVVVMVFHMKTRTVLVMRVVDARGAAVVCQ